MDSEQVREEDIRYACLYIPHSGLFFRGGEFFDGMGEKIAWKHTLPVFVSHARAVAAKEHTLAKYPNEYADGDLVVLRVELKEKV